MKTSAFCRSTVQAQVWLLFFLCITACRPGKQPSTDDTNQNVHEALIVRLLAEADSLIRTDSLFYYNKDYSGLHPCLHDSAVLSLQDSAIRLNPMRKRSYLTQYTYLIQSRQFTRMLPLLRRMEQQADTLLDADLRCMKAMLEDLNGDFNTAHRDFLKADSCYRAFPSTNRQDSAVYGVYRLSKAINLSLIKDNFATLHRELERYKAANKHVNTQALDTLAHINSKEAYYRFLFGEDCQMVNASYPRKHLPLHWQYTGYETVTTSRNGMQPLSEELTINSIRVNNNKQLRISLISSSYYLGYRRDGERSFYRKEGKDWKQVRYDEQDHTDTAASFSQGKEAEICIALPDRYATPGEYLLKLSLTGEREKQHEAFEIRICLTAQQEKNVSLQPIG